MKARNVSAVELGCWHTQCCHSITVWLSIAAEDTNACVNAEDLRIMHQQPPRAHQDADAVESEPGSPSKPGLLESLALRYSKAGSMIGRPPVMAHSAAAAPGLENKAPARLPLSLTHEAPQLAAQQEGSSLAAAAPSLQIDGHGLSVVRFPPIDQAAPVLPMRATDQQHQTAELWSASAHLQAVELLLDAAQNTSSSPQVALQHLQSISLLCQSCMVSLSGVQAAGRAAAPLQSMRSMCDSATEAGLQQAHAQHALWVSLRLLCRTVVQILRG